MTHLFRSHILFHSIQCCLLFGYFCNGRNHVHLFKCFSCLLIKNIFGRKLLNYQWGFKSWTVMELCSAQYSYLFLSKGNTPHMDRRSCTLHFLLLSFIYPWIVRSVTWKVKLQTKSISNVCQRKTTHQTDMVELWKLPSTEQTYLIFVHGQLHSVNSYKHWNLTFDCDLSKINCKVIILKS